MGSPAARLNDLCTGHGCFPPRPIVSGSPDVFVNGRNFARISDPLAKHRCRKSSHAGKIASGSSVVIVNGRKAAKIGDSVSCGSRIATGSGDVIVGG